MFLVQKQVIIPRVLALGLMGALLAAPWITDSARASEDPNPGSMTLTGNVDGVSHYMFRGIRQHATGFCIWPSVDLGVALYSGEGPVSGLGVNIGTWNSLNTGDTGDDGPSGEVWYESDFYATAGLMLAGGLGGSVIYTAYMSPNDAFTTVKEIAFKLAFDDSELLGKAALKPYGLVALELDTAMGRGQADGGSEAGRYLELGVAPATGLARASITLPVRLGVSLADYYELNQGTADAPSFEDNRFGYLSVAGLVSVPLGSTTRLGAWNLHAGLEYQALGDTPKAVNGDKGSRFIGSAGIGFSY
jgi:hypothetical protein